MNCLSIPAPSLNSAEMLMRLMETVLQFITLGAICLLSIALCAVFWLCLSEQKRSEY